MAPQPHAAQVDGFAPFDHPGALALLDHERVGDFYEPAPRALRERAAAKRLSLSSRAAAAVAANGGGRGGGGGGGSKAARRRVRRLQKATRTRHGGGRRTGGGRRVWITGAGENASTNTFFWDQVAMPMHTQCTPNARPMHTPNAMHAQCQMH